MSSVMDRPRRGANAFFMWAGHYMHAFLLTAISASILNDALSRQSWAWFLSWPVVIAWPLAMAAMVSAMNVHDFRLCERCIAATPLDPQAAVQRWRPALRLMHATWAMIAVAALTAAWWIGVRPWAFGAHLPWQGILIETGVLAATGTWWVAELKHRRLYPWCPYCHWGGGGPREQAPDPDPEDHGVRS